jgi:hypothetical protein
VLGIALLELLGANHFLSYNHPKALTNKGKKEDTMIEFSIATRPADDVPFTAVR